MDFACPCSAVYNTIRVVSVLMENFVDFWTSWISIISRKLSERFFISKVDQLTINSIPHSILCFVQGFVQAGSNEDFYCLNLQNAKKNLILCALNIFGWLPGNQLLFVIGVVRNFEN